MRILLTHTRSGLERYYGSEALARLRTCGEVTLNPGDEPLDQSALITLARDCDIIISDRQTPADAALFAALPNLAAFMRCAMDIRNIDLDAASRAGVLVTHATAGFADAVSELALGFMVDLARGVSATVEAYRHGKVPEIRMGRQLSASTIGIIGFGVIGQRLGTLAQALGMRVLATDPVRQSLEPGIKPVAFADLLRQADFVVCLAPATAKTWHLMNGTAFAAMPQGSYFINLARGELVDEAALAKALDSGHLAGAALDVGCAADQMPSLALAHRNNVIATPHIGGLTPEAVQHQAFDTVRQVGALAKAQLPDHAVNPESATRLRRLGIPACQPS